MTRINGEAWLKNLVTAIYKIFRNLLSQMANLFRQIANLFSQMVAKWRTFRSSKGISRHLNVTVHPHLLIQLVVLLVIIILTALGLRVFSPRTAMVITPFGIPVEGQTRPPYSGDSLANLMVDELQAIIRTSNDYTGTTDYSSSKQYNPLSETPKIPVQTSFELQIHGLSLNEALRFWNWLRYNQENISGEVMRTSSGKVKLRARLTSSSKAQYWDLPGEIDEKDIPEKMNALAARVFSDLHPETLGRYYLANRKYQNAKDVFAAWVKRKPENAEAYFELGYALAKMEQFDLAKEAEERAIALQRGNHAALEQLAIIDVKEADLMESPDAQALYKQAADYGHRAIEAACPAWRCWLHIGKRYPDYYGNLGVAYERLGRFEDALKVDSKVLSIDKQSAGAYANMGSTLLKMSEAEKDPSKKQKEVDEAVNHIRQALELKPYFPRHCGILIDTLLKAKSNQDAERIARWAVMMKPDAEEPLFHLGLVLLRQQAPVSNEILEKALMLHPQTPETLVEHAKALQNIGPPMSQRFGQAASRLLRDQLANEPDNAAIYRNLGLANWFAGDYKKASESFLAALNSFNGYGKFADFQTWLADSLYLSENLDAALTHYKTAIDLGSTAQNNCLFQFRFAHALRYSSSKDLNRAVDAYKKGESLNSSGQCTPQIEAQFRQEAENTSRERDEAQIAIKDNRLAKVLPAKTALPRHIQRKATLKQPLDLSGASRDRVSRTQ